MKPVVSKFLSGQPTTDEFVGPEMKNFKTGSDKISHQKAYQNLLKESYSHFSISCHVKAAGAFEVLSVVMTSSPEVVPINFFE